MSNAEDFCGAKIALFLGRGLLVLRRDDRAGLDWAGWLDLPGGGRDGAESPEACVIREVREETGLVLEAEALCWRRFYERPRRAWFFAAHLEAARAKRIALGDEGQGWCLMRPEDFVKAGDAIPQFRERVRDYLAERGAR